MFTQPGGRFPANHVSPPPVPAALGLGDALVELEANSGRLFDAKVVDVCLRLFGSEHTGITGRALGGGQAHC
jgi:HD-GYP domain-containing protein (c-di-GMP phosphodiesterase class II)